MNSLNDEELIRLHTSQKSDETGAPSEIDIESEMNRRGLIPKHAQERFLVKRLDGSQTGPHDILEMKNLFNDGTITADSPVHVQSLFGWVPLRNVFELEKWSNSNRPNVVYNSRSGENTSDASMLSSNFTASSELSGEGVVKDQPSEVETPTKIAQTEEEGIRRVAFIICILVSIASWDMYNVRTEFSLTPLSYDRFLLRIHSILCLLLFLGAVGQRLRNIGLTGWLSLSWLGLVLGFGSADAPKLAILTAIVPLLFLAISPANLVGSSRTRTNSFAKKGKARLDGYGGVLVLFTVSLVVQPLALFGFLMERELENRELLLDELVVRPDFGFGFTAVSTFSKDAKIVMDNLANQLNGILIFEAVSMLALTLFGLLVAFNLVREMPIGVRRAKLLIISSVIFSIFDSGLRFAILKQLSNSIGNIGLTADIVGVGLNRIDRLFMGEVLSLLLTVLINSVWFLYFTYSKRVKATYTRTPDTAEVV